MSVSTIQCESVFDLIQNNLKPGLINRLYGGDGLLLPADVKNNQQASSENEGYNSQVLWACKAIFQSLPSLSKHIILRFIFMEHDFKLSDFNPWVQNSPHHIKELHQHFGQLNKLNILIENVQSTPVNSNLSAITHSSSRSSVSMYNTSTFRIHHHFRINLLRAITYPQEPWSNIAPLSNATCEPKQFFETTVKVTIDRLDQFSDMKWENVLRYIVGATVITYTKIDILEESLQCIVDDTEYERRQNYLAQIDKHTESAIKSFLKATSLITEDFLLMQQLDSLQCQSQSQTQAQKLGYSITAKGYEYMLKDRSQQVWLFLSAVISRLANQEEAISFLFVLSFCELGKPYPVSALTQLQKKLLFEFSYMGLLYLHNVKSKFFYPTRVSIDLLLQKSLATQSSSSSSSSVAPPNSLLSTPRTSAFQVIVETNNQVIAYTNNDLDLAMLGLFVEIQLRMPNMVYGKLTRDKAKAAYKVGIKASQIIDFLISHAHPIVIAAATAHASTNSSSYNIAGTTDASTASAIKSAIIPQNVADQLLTWEAENFRIHARDALVITLSDIRGFNMGHFRQVSAYLKRTNAVLWENEKKLLLAVTPAGAELLPSFIEEVIQI